MQPAAPPKQPLRNELITLDTLFQQRIFRIPDYQRGYSWNTEHVDAFWKDLGRLGESRRHYTGQITVREVPEDETRAWLDERHLLEGQGAERYQPFYVVDGQQRLTTAIILIKCLLDRLSPGDKIGTSTKEDLETKYLYQQGQLSRVYLFGYARGGPGYDYFKSNILGQSSGDVAPIESVYTLNLCEARDYFLKQLAGASQAEIAGYFEALTQRCLFNWNELVPELDEYVVFETMNNRGKKVSDLELLKNRLIHLCACLPEDTANKDRRALRERINQAWTAIYEHLGCIRNWSLNDDKSFLLSHTIMYFRRHWKVVEFLFDEHFTVGRVHACELKITPLADYSTSLQGASKAWRAIHAPLHSHDLSAELKTWLERLSRLDHGAFIPLLMATLQHKDEGQDAQVALLQEAERFRFVVGSLCRRRANTGDTHFYGLAWRLFKKHCRLVDAVAEVRAWTDEFFWLERAITESEGRFRDRDGFYHWSGIRYLLYEYEQFVRGKHGVGAPTLDWQKLHEQRDGHVTIEHIYPVQPRPGDWPSFAGFTEAELRRLNHSLGNLLPLSHSRNSSLSNRPFRTKCGDDGKVRGYDTGCHSEIEVAKEPEWTPKTIEKRGLEILKFFENHWRINLGSRAERLKFLGLEFMEKASPSETDHQGSEGL